MDLNQMREEFWVIFTQIFNSLPEDEKMSLTESVNLTDSELCGLTPKAFDSILSSSCKNVQVIKFPKSNDFELVKVLAKFSCSQLRELDIGPSIGIGSELLGDLIKSNPNMEALACNVRGMDFPEVVICDKWIRLKIANCNENFLRSLTGKCPNLKHLELHLTDPISVEVLDDFFNACPYIETMDLQMDCTIKVDIIKLRRFWCLPLKNLILSSTSKDINDNILIKISTSFSQLDTLELNGLTVTSEGTKSLAQLQCLKRLSLLALNGNMADLNEGLQHLAACTHLQEAQFDVVLLPNTVSHLICACSELRYLGVDSITEVSMFQKLQFYHDMRSVRYRDLVIKIRNGDHQLIKDRFIEREGDIYYVEFYGMEMSLVDTGYISKFVTGPLVPFGGAIWPEISISDDMYFALD